MASSFIYDEPIGIVQSPMRPTVFGNFCGYALITATGVIVRFLSETRFPADTAVCLRKTLNDAFYWCRVEQTLFINGMTKPFDDEGFVTGSLF